MALAILAATLGSAASAPAAITPANKALFERHVRPILVKHCYECHSAEAKKIKGGLLLDSLEGWMNGGDSGEVIEPGHPEKSLLIEAVRYDDPDMEMPPKYKLRDSEIAVLTRWVKVGAPDPRTGASAGPARRTIDVEAGRKFWSFQPVSKPQIPRPQRNEWARTDIDRLVLARLESASLAPVADADRRTLLRRLSYDLVGLPPTPEEFQAFLNDSAPGALDRVVDRLLQSPRFGERWGRHWMDVVRYAESTGRTRNYAFQYAWRYRDYVIDSFNADKPYDRFVREQVAGDLLPADSPAQRDEQVIATGFLALGAPDLNERDKVQFKMDQVDEQIDVTSRAVLGLTMACARCHDHKFDPIPTEDYYALAGIFKSTDTLIGYGAKQGGGNKLSPKALISIGADDSNEQAARDNHERQIREVRQESARLQQEIKKLTGALKDRKNLRRQETQRELAAAKKKIRPLRNRLKQLEKDGPVSAHMAMGVQEGSDPDHCRVHVRGDHTNQGKSVPRGYLQVISAGNNPPIPADQSGRRQLAQWLTSPRNPLAARVMVNRIWYHLFGQGLVRTVDNFGETGDRPADPQLLDYLAARFVEDGWSVKKLIRLIATSRTYQLSSSFDSRNYEADPENRLHWRMNQRRLEVEALRDGMLLVSGQLNLEPPVASPMSKMKSGELGRQVKFDQGALASNRRSVYVPVVRSFVPVMFETFDFAEPSS
ncbi:MAG: DUF1549 domain-containing protein, partial [Phycisphaerae bacterium]|nr:DUF1549 domain-containing protein [Phycisphaerae bacterium]